jgi:hypothetical protein
MALRKHFLGRLRAALFRVFSGVILQTSVAGGSMKNITYKKREFIDRGRAVSIRENSSDKECATRVMKNFVYLVSMADSIPEDIGAPQIRIIKKVVNEPKIETFLFRIKGEIFVKEKRFIYRVQYCHSLYVHLFWKNHVLSSKPAALA